MGNNKLNELITTIVLGNIFLENYYVVFDLSTIAGDDPFALPQIGFGTINPRNVLGDSIYDSTDASFDKTLNA